MSKIKIHTALNFLVHSDPKAYFFLKEGKTRIVYVFIWQHWRVHIEQFTSDKNLNATPQTVLHNATDFRIPTRSQSTYTVFTQHQVLIKKENVLNPFLAIFLINIIPE